MLTASEANEKATKIIKDFATYELSKLENQINEAIQNGHFSITNAGSLPCEAQKVLEGLGYKVTRKCQYNEPSYSISWK